MLKETWEEAGFKVTLDALADTYYDVIQTSPTRTATSSGAAGVLTGPPPSPSLPPLFDCRATSNRTRRHVTNLGQDYGYYQSETFEGLVDEAATRRPLDTRTAHRRRTPARQRHRLHPAGHQPLLLAVRL